MKNSTMKIILSLIFITSFFSLLAQNQSEKTAEFLKEDAFKTFDSNEVIGNGYIVALRDRGYTVVGTTYLLEELLPGKIKKFKNGEYLEGVELRYNIFYDRLEVKAHDVLFAAINDQVSEFIINDGNNDYHFYNSTSFNGSKSSLGYIRVVHRGDKYSFFAKDMKVKQVKESRGAYASSGKGNVLAFVDRISYYIYDEVGKELIELKSKKKLTEQFPELKGFGNFSNKDLKSEKFIASLGTFMNKSN